MTRQKILPRLTAATKERPSAHLIGIPRLTARRVVGDADPYKPSRGRAQKILVQIATPVCELALNDTTENARRNAEYSVPYRRMKSVRRAERGIGPYEVRTIESERTTYPPKKPK